MSRSRPLVLVGFLCRALLGLAVVLAGTEFWRAGCVRRTLARSECVLASGHPGATLAHLSRVGAWSAAYPALERRRLCLVVRCHVLRSELPDAQAAADLAVEADSSAGLATGDTGPLEFTLTRLVELAWLRRDPDAALGPWEGYRVLIRDLRRRGLDAAAETALETGAARFPDGRWPDDVLAFVCDRPVPAPAARGVPSASDAAGLTTSPPAATPPAGEPPVEPAPPPAESPRWAVVRAVEGRAFDDTGAFLRLIPPGTLLDVQEMRDTASGTAAVCRLPDGEGSPFLVPPDDLDVRPGRLADADATERALRSRRATVAARLERCRSAGGADPAVSDANPHAAALLRARGALDALQRRAESVQARWETATGSERMTCADELRTMKPEQVRLEAAFEQARARSEAWVAAHPPPSPEADEAELARIDKQLETF